MRAMTPASCGAPRRHGNGTARRVIVAAGMAALLSACGYHLVGRSSTLPSGVDSIGIPTFVNRTNRPELEQRITEQVIDQFTIRGRVRILPGEEGAKAVLRGEILSYTSTPVVINEQGRASRYEIRITAHVALNETTTDHVMWEDNHFLFKQQYDVAATQDVFVDQEIVAIELVANDFAKSVVTSILEGF